MPNAERDFDVEKEREVHANPPVCWVNAESGGQSRTDEWHVAEWDDVWWWAVARLPEIDPPLPDLWRVAP